MDLDISGPLVPARNTSRPRRSGEGANPDDDEDPPALPYLRSGTQIFGQDNNKHDQEEFVEESDDPPKLPYLRSNTQIFARKSGDDDEEVDESLEDLWNKYEADPNFFKDITLAKDGGMSEVDELVGPVRYITGAIRLALVFINTWSILTVNAAYVFTDDTKIFLVSKHILTYIPGTDAWTENGLAIVGVLEIALILVYLLRIFYWVWFIVFPGDGPERTMWRWTAVQECVWNAIPEAGAISALKMLYFVAPSILLPSLIATITTASGVVDGFFRLVWFFGSRGIAAIVGFDGFLFKMQTVSFALRDMVLDEAGNEKDIVTFGALLTAFITGMSLLNQVLGVVQLNWYVRMRVFAFIFAGEDGRMSDVEEATKETWESMLAQRIWDDLPPLQAIAAYLSYSDMDFQKLALETVKPGFQRQHPPSKKHVERMLARATAADGDEQTVELAQAS